jgi:FkbM family methyltransferase
MNPSLKKAIPLSWREMRYRVRRLGISKYIQYRRIERVERQKPPPRAGCAFDIGGGEIVLDQTTLPSVLSHWVEYAHGIQELQAFKALALSHDVLLDIGAAEGIYSAAFCALTGRSAWAFEPSREMFDRLARLCAANPGFAIEVTNVALDAHVGQRAITRHPDGQFSGVRAPDESDVMEVTTLDAFVAEHDLRPDFAKIDVEGMELDVLRGGEITFRHSVKTIVLEVHYDFLHESGQSAAELQMVLESYGFSLEALDGTAVTDLEGYARANPEVLPGYTVVVCRRDPSGRSLGRTQSGLQNGVSAN